MKRIFIILLSLVTVAIGTFAQKDVIFGARAGMEITMPSGSSSLYKTGSGFKAGAVAQISLPKSFFFEPGLMFYYTSMDAKFLTTFDDEYYYNGQAKFYGLRVPLNVGYNADIADNMVLGLNTGPYINVNLSAKQNYDPNFSAPERVPDSSTNLFSHGWRRVDAGWSFGVSLTFAEHYSIGLDAGLAFTPLARFRKGDKTIHVHRNMVALSLGYNF